MTDASPPQHRVDAWEIRCRGGYTAAVDWTDDHGPVAAYLVLTSTRDGHRLEFALTWAQIESVCRTAAARLTARQAAAEASTGELPRLRPGPPGYG